MTATRLFALSLLLLMTGFIWVSPGMAPHVVPLLTPEKEAVTYALDDIDVITQTGTHALKVDVALTDAAQQQGMMYRTEWGDIQGMLFVFDRSQIRHFWMKNTELPLDIIFFDDEGKVTNIIQSARPHDKTLLPSVMPAKYVLEIPAEQTVALQLDGTARLVVKSIMESE